MQDIVSNLPNDIIEIILMHLPIKDAVKTGALSSHWHRKWASIADLTFANDDKNLMKSGVVDRILSQHAGPIRRLSCEFSVPQRIMSRWIRILSKKGLMQLAIRRDWMEGGLKYVPSSIFCSGELRYLELSAMILLRVPQKFEGFANLKELRLGHVGFRNKGDFERLISMCPLLERLTFDVDTDHGAPGFFIIMHPNLKYLCINGGIPKAWIGRCRLLAELSITATSHMSRDVTSTSVNLRASFLDFLLIGLPEIEKLELKGSFLELFRKVKVPVRHPITSLRLKYLSIKCDLECTKQVLAASFIWRSAPHLQELKITLYHCPFDEEIPSMWDGPELNGSFNCLKSVGLLGIAGKSSELEFIESLLANTPVLEIMGFRINSNAYTTCFKRKRKKLVHLEVDLPKILEDLMGFQRASARAEIKYLGTIRVPL